MPVIFFLNKLSTMKQLHTKLLTLGFVLAGGLLSAQSFEPFWSEHFSNNIPEGWTNSDASNQNVIWKWCANNTSGCSPVFNGEAEFMSETAATGYVHVNSDGAGPLPQSHISRLTTSVIDCSGKNNVFIKFQSHLATYTVTPASSALLRVSTDLSNWTNFMAFPDLLLANEFSPNPYTTILDISSVAANEQTVYLQWQWTGNYEYMWNLDDIELYSQNPTPQFDLVISNFFYPASSFATPASQIGTDTFGFFILLSNRGLQPMTNVKVKAIVEDLNSSDILFADSVLLEVVAPGVTDSAVEMPHQYAPELPEGEYIIRYLVQADSADLRPDDNNSGSPFIVTGNVFSKENGANTATRPAADVAWTVGNYYVMSSGQFDAYKAMTVEFAFETDPDELNIADVRASIALFKVNDDVPSDFEGFDTQDFPGNSVMWLGFADYEAPDGIADYQLQQTEIMDFETLQQGVLLEPGGRYFLTASYDEDVRKTNHAFSTEFNYFRAVSTITYSDQWYLGGFGDDLSALLRMYISLASTTDEQPLPASALHVFPNPVSDAVNLAVQFDQPTDATITIADLGGRVISLEDRQGLTTEQITYRLPQLASGMYLARIATREGTRTVKFVVQR
jgi:hypothetical protein